MTYSFSVRRVFALLMTVLLVLCQMPFGALANELPPFEFVLSWPEGDFLTESVSVPVTEPGYEGSYWLYAPEGAVAADATLEIRDTYMQYASFSPASLSTLSQLFYTDAADLGAQPLEIMAFDAAGQHVNTLRLYISAQSATPVASAPAAPVPVTTTVPVYYVDQNGSTLHTSSATVSTGDNPVYADDGLLGDYNRTSDGTVWVNVDYNSNCTPSSVTFRYEPKSVTTNVDIVYIDSATGAEVGRSFASVSTGTQSVEPDYIPEGYSFADITPVSVTVDAYGNCTPAVVTFYCNPLTTTTNIDILYVDSTTGMELGRSSASVSTGTQSVAPGFAPDGYTLADSTPVSVTVDAYGNCSPAVVTFYCDPLTTATNIDILYVDSTTGAEIGRSFASVSTGTQSVEPDYIPEGYSFADITPVSVTVDAYGNCNPAVVTFYCNPLTTTTNIDIVYIDSASGTELYRASAPVSTGTQSVAPEYIPDGYAIVDSTPVSVTVDAYGVCSPASVAFYCVPLSTSAGIDIIYLDSTTGAELSRSYASVSTGTQSVAPDYTPAGYVLDNAAPVSVTVDAYGNCTPSVITFYCTPASVTVNVPVYYYDGEGALIAQGSFPVSTGKNTVYADLTLIPNYLLEGPFEATVTVDAFGVCTPESVSFFCKLPDVATDTPKPTDKPTPKPTHTPEPVVTPDLDASSGYGYVTANSVRLRVGPATDFVALRTMSRYALASILGAEVVNGEIWYHIILGDTEGYVIGDYFKVLSPKELTKFLDSDEYRQSEDNKPAATETPFVPVITATPTEDIVVTLAPVITATPEPATASVPVYYVNLQGETIHADSVLLTQGSNPVVPQSHVLPEGYSLENDVPVVVTVDEHGVATPTEVVFRTLGGEPEATPAPVDVLILYLDENDNPVASATMMTCYVGINHVYPKPYDLRDNYALIGEEKQFVVVDDLGATPDTITFRYAYQPPVTPTPTAVPAPKIALVPVRYKLQNGEPFYVDNTYTCTEGDNIVTPNAQYVPAGYVLQSAPSVLVTVDNAGKATPAYVEFTYSTGITSRDITVFFRDVNGNDVASPQVITCYVGMNLLTCEPFDLREGYKLLSRESVEVYMDEMGNLTLGGQPITEGVVYLYEAPPTPTPPPTAIPYQIHPMSGYCYPKSDTINFRSEPSTASANTVLRVVTQKDLGRIDGYVVNEHNEKWYIVTIGGQSGFLRENVVRLLSQSEINALFGYTPTPAPTAIPDGSIIDRWGTVNTASVNFRDGIGGERLYMMPKGSYIFVYESETVNGETWYHARFNDGKGYEDGSVMAKFVTLLSEEESFAYQQSLPTPMPVRTAEPTMTLIPSVTPTPTLAATATPIPTDTPAPTIAVTATPAPYTGYALTTRAVDLRTGVTLGDTTLITLPAHTLVYLWGQAHIDGICWHSAEALQANLSGYLPDDVLVRITSEEAAPYLNALIPQTTATPMPTATPAPFSGYAVTNGNNVLLRGYANTNAEIIEVLPAGEVVWVLAQDYTDGEVWQIVRYGQIYGFIRGDQLRMMSYEESIMYEESLRTPTPQPIVTPTIAPITQESLSSYGYVTTNNVRLRSGAGTQHGYIRMMNQYAFALVLGTQEADGTTWYHINQAGTEGYVMGDYFKVLSMGELTEFLTSDEYLQSQDTPVAGNPSAGTGNGLTSYEDFNNHIWQNPAATASYEPFSNLIQTPTPNVEIIVTPTPSPTVSVLPTTNFEPFTTPSPNADGGSGNGILWLALAGLGILAGGGVYAYSIHRENQRRAAQRAAQRKAAQQQAQRYAAYQRPQMQYPQQQTQKYQSAFTPPTPRPMQPTEPNAQNAPADENGAPVRRRRSDRYQG